MKTRKAAALILLASCAIGSQVVGNDAEAALETVCHPNRDAWVTQCSMQMNVCKANGLKLQQDRQSAALSACSDDQAKCEKRFPPCNFPKQCVPDPRQANTYVCTDSPGPTKATSLIGKVTGSAEKFSDERGAQCCDRITSPQDASTDLMKACRALGGSNYKSAKFSSSSSCETHNASPGKGWKFYCGKAVEAECYK